MYNELILALRKKGITFDKGLSENEIENIETEYEICFPKQLKKFYSIALPISEGFYNWRDKGKENVNFIKSIMVKPSIDLIDEIDEIYWCDGWGEEPAGLEEKKEILINLFNDAPKLIPIYSHRFLSSIEVEYNPVFSIHGTDVIYYGENLYTYLEIEFGLKEYSKMNCDNISYIPFWSDLL